MTSRSSVTSDVGQAIEVGDTSLELRSWNAQLTSHRN